MSLTTPRSQCRCICHSAAFSVNHIVPCCVYDGPIGARFEVPFKRPVIRFKIWSVTNGSVSIVPEAVLPGTETDFDLAKLYLNLTGKVYFPTITKPRKAKQ